jgi:hypothetical protein
MHVAVVLICLETASHITTNIHLHGFLPSEYVPKSYSGLAIAYKFSLYSVGRCMLFSLAFKLPIAVGNLTTPSIPSLHKLSSGHAQLPRVHPRWLEWRGINSRPELLDVALRSWRRTNGPESHHVRSGANLHSN